MMDIQERLLGKWFDILSSKPLFTLEERDGYKIKMIAKNMMTVYGHDSNGTEIGEWFFKSEVIEDDPHQNTEIIQDERDEQVQLDLF